MTGILMSHCKSALVAPACMRGTAIAGSVTRAPSPEAAVPRGTPYPQSAERRVKRQTIEEVARDRCCPDCVPSQRQPASSQSPPPSNGSANRP